MSSLANQLNGAMFLADLKDRLPSMTPDDLDGLVAFMRKMGLDAKGHQDRMEAMSELARKLREHGASSYREYESMKN